MIVSMTHSKKQIRKRKTDSNDAMLAAVKKEMANLAWPSRPEDLNRLDRRLRIEYSHGKFFRINLQQGLPITFSPFGIVHVAHGRPRRPTRQSLTIPPFHADSRIPIGRILVNFDHFSNLTFWIILGVSTTEMSRRARGG